MLVALGFKRGTHIYLAGAHIYGGQSRMVALTSLYPNLVTKEDLLSSEEIRPFANFSSQVNHRSCNHLVTAFLVSRSNICENPDSFLS